MKIPILTRKNREKKADEGQHATMFFSYIMVKETRIYQLQPEPTRGDIPKIDFSDVKNDDFAAFPFNF